MKGPLFTLAAPLATLAPAPVAAQAGATTGQISIDYRDLNLSTPEGQAVLDQRINKAARSICAADEQTTGTRIPSSEAVKCVSKAKAQAKTQVAAAIAAQQRGG